MISVKQNLTGKVNIKSTLVGNINNGNRGFDNCISKVKMENEILYLTFIDGTIYTIDLNSYLGDETTGLTQEQIEAINNMVAILGEDLVLEYDDKMLDIEFKIENGNMIVTNNVTGLDFSINENGEMEAMY